jgi:hypothetical protein
MKELSMLKIVKNRFFNLIKDSGLSHDLFEVSEYDSKVGLLYGKDVYKIELRDTSLSFILKEFGPMFRYEINNWNPNYNSIVMEDLKTIDEIEPVFSDWLEEQVKTFLEEIKAPDLWTQYAENIDSIPPFKTSGEEYKEFSDDEKVQIKQSVSNYRLLVIENYNPNDEQLEEINEQLEYLSQAVDRLNRRDWKGLAISTVISIGINLAVNPEGGRHLFELFQEAFSYLIQLLL